MGLRFRVCSGVRSLALNDRVRSKKKCTLCRPMINKPPPLIGIIIGIRTFRPLKGGGLLIRGLHYPGSMREA